MIRNEELTFVLCIANKIKSAFKHVYTVHSAVLDIVDIFKILGLN